MRSNDYSTPSFSCKANYIARVEPPPPSSLQPLPPQRYSYTQSRFSYLSSVRLRVYTNLLIYKSTVNLPIFSHLNSFHARAVVDLDEGKRLLISLRADPPFHRHRFPQQGIVRRLIYLFIFFGRVYSRYAVSRGHGGLAGSGGGSMD